MNHRNIILIERFCNQSVNNYSLPGNILANIVYLNTLANEWKKFNEKPYVYSSSYDTNRNNLADEMQKTIINFLEKISNTRISMDLIHLFSEIILDYMDNIEKNKSVLDELANAFNKMAVTYQMPKIFADEISKLSIYLMTKLLFKISINSVHEHVSSSPVFTFHVRSMSTES